MSNHRFRSLIICAFVLVSMLGHRTGVLAGTTGNLSGAVVEAGATTPIAGATVTATSPSQTAKATTDAQGRFVLLSLAPDTYTVSVEKQGFEPTSLSGVNVLADQSQTLSLAARPALREIGRVSARAASDLVRSGTTADVYSVNAAAATAAQALGGGGGLNNVYSAVASVPGAYVPTNQAGWFQNVSIRGGDYNQVGYEFDGVPVNRSFDNYPAHTASALGQQEVQVYTGQGPANAEATGSSGFINQVIRSGTYPGFSNLTIGTGGPQFYHDLSFEVGGATPNRNFSYYAGLGGYDEDFRYYDQFNGASLASTWGQPYVAAACPANGNRANFAACYASGQGPAGYILGPYNAGQPAHIADREGLLNLHFGIPHKSGIKDDIQILLNSGALKTSAYNSINDWGGAQFFSAAGQPLPNLPTSFQWKGAIGVPLPSNYASLVSVYRYPSSDASLLPNAPLPFAARDTQYNDQGIFKVQYQHNFGSSAYFRMYGYTFYSDWLLDAPFQLATPFGDAAGYQNIAAPDYELITHTRGLSGTFADQINAKNLLTLVGSVTTASTVRNNNTESIRAGDPFAFVVDAGNPTSGICYNVSGAPAPVTCSKAAATTLKFPQAQAGQALNLSGLTCGTGPCEYYVAEDGQHATYNTVKPLFVAAALTDQWRPNEKFVVDLGLRYDSYQYKGSDTTGPARDFWFNAWNRSKCVSTVPASAPVDKGGLGIPITSPCSAANTASASYVPATLFNVSAPVYTFNFLEPRVGMTFTQNLNNVYRFSFGKYTQPTSAAFEQYNTLQQDLPDFIGSEFYKFGFNQPGHDEIPSITYNFDVSWEHQFRGTDASFKLSPFYRRDFNENQTFYINPNQGFVSGLPVAVSSIRGVELALRKGDFGRNGFAAQLAYTYTYSTLRYTRLPNGTTVLSPINNDIKTYNAYTSFCSTNPNDKRCGTPSNGAAAAPCYVATTGAKGINGGIASPCNAPGAYANPYWDAPVQSLFDEGGIYFPTDPIVSGPTLQANSYAVPHVATLVLNYKHDKWAFTPSLQFSGGQRYGVPESVIGIDPAGGCSPLASAATGDPRYPYGSPGGLAYDATTCPSTLTAVPDPFTHKFDNIGAFVAPSQLLLNAQIAYQATPKVTFRLALTNLLNTCFGGSTEPWTGLANNKVCSYNNGGAIASVFPVANIYNPGSNFQPFVRYPYVPQFGQYVVNNNFAAPSSPFNFFLSANIKL